MTTTEAHQVALAAISQGVLRILKQPELTTKGTPRKRGHLRMVGWTKEQKHERHKQQMREYHRKNNMSIESANQIINEQEDAIAELKHKVLNAEDQRDLERDHALKLIDSLKRIQSSENLWTAQHIAKQAVEDYK